MAIQVRRDELNPNAAIHEDSGCFVPKGQPEISRWWSEAKPPDRRTKANRPEGCEGTCDLRRFRRPDRGECPAFAGSRWFRSFLTPPPANFLSALRAFIAAFELNESHIPRLGACLTLPPVCRRGGHWTWQTSRSTHFTELSYAPQSVAFTTKRKRQPATYDLSGRVCCGRPTISMGSAALCPS